MSSFCLVRAPHARSAFVGALIVLVAALSTASCALYGNDDDSGGSSNGSDIPEERVWPELAQTPRLPIGMNLSELNYYSPFLLFTDAMTTAGDMISFTAGVWDSGKIDRIARDSNGYPLSLPVSIDGEETRVRFLVNNHYSGRYRIVFEGNGTLGGSAQLIGTRWYIDLDGSGSNQYIEILFSDGSNPVRNMRILPEAYVDASTGSVDPDVPLFLSPVVDELRKFSVIRFMDIQRTNFSVHRNWSDRPGPGYYSQATIRGMAHEYAIALCNETGSDAWVCVPHMASDEYIRSMAALWKEGLRPDLKIYLEFSNEVWNFGFAQFHWIENKAEGGNLWGYDWPAAVDSYVIDDLKALSSVANYGFPERNAYMMERTFRLWNEVFGAPERVINVATGQSPWYDVTERVARYLDSNASGDARAEALSVGGYFIYTQSDHNYWVTHPSHATPGLMMDRVLAAQEKMIPGGTWYDAKECAAIAKKYELDFLVYEGGQHLQPYNQMDWPYNKALWDAQIHEKMYRMYMLTFAEYVKPEVDCSLYVAFHFMGARKSKYGSWGHLESLAQIGSDYRTTAPKYQALLDANARR